MKITNILARQILDSRGNPTLLVRVETQEGFGEFAVPSGASTGSFEAYELRDKDPNYFQGRSVLKAIEKVEKEIKNELVGMEVSDQEKIDQTLIKLDGTENKSNLGGNSMIGVSLACCKAAAKVSGQEVYQYLKSLSQIKPSFKIPHLYVNLINGGKHARSRLPFQEYHLVTLTEDIEESLQTALKIQGDLRELIIRKLGNASANFGDEGGFVIDSDDIKLPLDLLQEVVEKNGYQDQVKLALDVATSSFFQESHYQLGEQRLEAAQLMDLYLNLAKNYPLISIEDPFFEEDFQSFTNLSKSTTLMLVGDDLTVTNRGRLKKAIEESCIKGVIIKPNQVGTLTETLGAMKLARDNNIECIVSHRSGETNDDFIVDLALAFGCFGLKAGALARGERVAKYNRLLSLKKVIS